MLRRCAWCCSEKHTHITFTPIQVWHLNVFCLGFLEPWRYLANQLAFPPVLSGTIVSSAEGIAQCTTEVAKWWIALITSEPIYFWSKCCTRFQMRLANWNRTHSRLLLKGYQCTESWVDGVLFSLADLDDNVLYQSSEFIGPVLLCIVFGEVDTPAASAKLVTRDSVRFANNFVLKCVKSEMCSLNNMLEWNNRVKMLH